MSKDFTGEVFGRLTVIVFSHTNKRRYSVWNCLCTCGKTIAVISSDLTSGHTKSCGCLKIDSIKKVATTHGLSRTPEYEIWGGIIKRCENKRNKHYADYGGRGIKVCERWRNSFENFLSDMGKRPSPNHSIDRKENNGDYDPGNCRWSTIDEQARNKRNNVRIERNGEVLVLEDWAKRLNITRSVAQTIIKNNSEYKILN